jgi:hypothetical protein
MPQILQTGLLYILLTLLTGTIALNVGDWLMRYSLNLPL